jgi:ABC-type sugar transport system permease subunit
MKWTDRNIAILLTLPAIVYVIAFAFYPIALAVYGSFQTPSQHLVLSNYQLLPSFGVYEAIENTLVVTGFALLWQFILAFAAANMLMRQFRGRSMLYASMIIPYASATVVAAFIFGNIFTTGQGSYLNSFLSLFGISPINWTGVYQGSYPLNVLTIVLADGWKNISVVALILMAGMTTIPQEIYRAAEIDGAGTVQKFLRVTLPNLKGYIAIALIIRGVSEFNIFAIALLLFPYKLLTTLTYGLYDIANPYLSYASATVLLGLVLVFAVIVAFYRSRGI